MTDAPTPDGPEATPGGSTVAPDRPETATAAPRTGAVRRSASAQLDRRVVIASAAVLIGALLLGVAVVALTYDPEPTSTTTTLVGESPGAAAAPGIIPKPNSGTAPEKPGDRGGWEQLALMGLILVALVGIGVIVAKGGGARARANRAAWRAAADGPDGGVDRDPPTSG